MRTSRQLATLLRAGVGSPVTAQVKDGKLCGVELPKHRFSPRSRVRCQYREHRNYRKEKDGGHDLVRMKFRCRWCKAWVCGECEGTHDDLDPVGNKLCDPCWTRRAKRREKNVKQRSFTLP